ncbi:MAG: GntR family transcriptional regulator [Brevinema sp.]
MIKRQFVEDYIIDAIKSGVFQEGQKLETEEQMSQRFGVSVVTIKNALHSLVNSGYLRRAQGLGTFVAPNNNSKIPIGLTLKGFREIANDTVVTLKTRVITIKKMIPPSDVVFKLGLEPKEKVLFYERINLFDRIPVSFEIGYLKMGLVPEIKKKDLEISRYQYYAQHGCPIVRVKKTIIPIVPEKRITKFLNVQGRPPLQLVENISYNQNNNITDFTAIYYNPDKYILELEVGTNKIT